MRNKWTVKSWVMIACVSLYFVSVMNIAFWRYVLAHLKLGDSRSYLFAASMPVVFLLVFLAFFSLVVWPYVGKAILTVLLILSASANYFMVKLNVIIDSGMIRNVWATNPAEAMEMVTVGGILWVALLGMLPSAVIWKTTIQYRPFFRELASRGIAVVVCLALFSCLGLLFYKDYVAVGRNNKIAGKLINPANYISANINYIKQLHRANRDFVVIDKDPLHTPYNDPYITVLVLMVGETARAKNFSLNGYPRDTNPKLAKQDIINFQQVTSSGTATAFSLPCMFSHLPRATFDIDSARNSENLLDVMQKAGYDILWLDNDGGSKGVSDRVPTIDLMQAGDPKFRSGDTFYDEVLLDGLEERIRGLTRNTVLVLHMMGSHGPSYYRRYPDSFRVFTPVCDNAEIQSEPMETIVNTYDNTILYTDHVVAGAIDILKKFPQHEAGLLYVSDHGESLGENGLYLHGFPYAFAPREQIHIPMILWMSETMKREDHIDYEKLRANATSLQLSHDNLFHSILGLVEVDSDLYDPALDFFSEFRTKKLPYR